MNNIDSVINSCINNNDGIKNILIADDSNISLNFLTKNINTEYKVLRANDGIETISLIANNDIYALILDINMPRVNGFEVLEYLKENNLIDKIPVVIITGDDTDETLKKVSNYPILSILNKPFSNKGIDKILISIQNFYKKNQS